MIIPPLTPLRLLLAALSVAIVALIGINGWKQAVHAETSLTYYISPTGNDANDGLSTDAPFQTIQKGIDNALPGDSVQLLDGIYLQDIATRRDGSQESPITITGNSAAIVQGSGSVSAILTITHNNIAVNGFTIDGKVGPGLSETDYRKKLVYAMSSRPLDGVAGVRIMNMILKNAQDECLRFRYFAHENEISYNAISACGVADFVFGGGGKNGEAVYLGTAPEQWGLNGAPTADPDVTTRNWVHHNTIDSQGSECVDVKEAAYENIVEYNTCTNVRDAQTGGMDSRGNNNVFRFNTIIDNSSAGIRFGGDTPAWGINNDAYGNTIRNNENGGIKFMNTPQGIICGNTMIANTGGDSTGTYGNQFFPASPCPDPTPTFAPLPTATIIPSLSPTPSYTMTPTPTSPPTSTSTPMPTLSPSPAPKTVTLAATEDAYVASNQSSKNFGSNSRLKTDGSPVYSTYIKFDLGSLSGKQILSATLRIKVADETSSDAQRVKPVDSVSWTQAKITYRNRPDMGSTPLGTFTALTTNSWNEVVVTSHVIPNTGKKVSFGLDTTSPNTASFYSRETSEKPVLVISYQ